MDGAEFILTYIWKSVNIRSSLHYTDESVVVDPICKFIYLYAFESFILCLNVAANLYVHFLFPRGIEQNYCLRVLTELKHFNRSRPLLISKRITQEVLY